MSRSIPSIIGLELVGAIQSWYSGSFLSPRAALVESARTDSDLRSVLFDIVSGHETYRNIVRRRGNVGLLLRTAPAVLARLGQPALR